jgi:hypothetical protein
MALQVPEEAPLAVRMSWPAILEMARDIQARAAPEGRVDVQAVRKLANAVLLFQMSLVQRPR